MSNTKDTPMDYKQFEGHTPGPWSFDDGHIFIEDKNREYNSIATVHDIYTNDGVVEINSKLLTAAPDLLKENQELKLELQKQKELNAELVNGLQYIKKTLGVLTISQDTPEGRVYNEAESLIKKSSEI